MLIGIMGGTFNPPHMGHINAARAAMRELGLDKLIFIPDSVPPHKEISEFSPSAKERFEMTRLAALEARAEVSDIELRREGKSYTVDTLAMLSEIYPKDELWLIIGTDMFLSIEQWREPERLLSMAALAVVPRNDGDMEALSAHASMLYRKYGVQCRIIDTLAVTISSSDIRPNIKDEDFRKYIPESVYNYIMKKGLYGVGEGDAT